MFRRRRRRRRIIAIVVVLVLLAGGAGYAAYRLLKAPGNISHPNAAFDATAAGGKPRHIDLFQWPLYGYSHDHRRTFQPFRPLRGPYRLIWHRHASALLEFPPTIAHGTLFQLEDNGILVALSTRTGRLRWRRKLGRLAASTPAIEGGRLYAVLLQSLHSSGGRVVSLRLSDGKLLWSHTLPSRSESSPNVDHGRVFFGSENGTVYCLNGRNGRTRWTYHAAGAVKGSPTLSNGILYFGDYGSHVQAVRARNGSKVWDNGAAQGVLRSGTFYATAAVAFGRVYIGSTDGRAYSFTASDGKLAWAQQTGGYVYSSAAVTNVRGLGPTVFFGSYDGTFYALNARSGGTRWTHHSGGKISGSPTVIGNTVYYADLGRDRTFGLNTRTGHVAFRHDQGGFDPAVSDGRHLFITSRRWIDALKPARQATLDLTLRR